MVILTAMMTPKKATMIDSMCRPVNVPEVFDFADIISSLLPFLGP
ncbi:hypothetical protein CEV31_1619 [Brucella thiophenivorans]|uniref:Uncharacterized protein n=1 Tax=Brucella thiophenivorans TaxID=571255 RepID=A0A256FZC5_9HYPH|nr:hypothetical protein CEV31_1619 [Brucella thiophenivorans]